MENAWDLSADQVRPDRMTGCRTGCHEENHRFCGFFYSNWNAAYADHAQPPDRADYHRPAVVCRIQLSVQ